jgi:branched-subunit amino acid transport protein
MTYSNSFYVLMILGMFAVTFSIRFIFFALANKVSLPLWLEQALNFVPVAVLTAIITPMVLLPDNATAISLNLQNPWLIASLAAFAAGLILRKPVLTILIGLVVFFIVRLIL